MYIYMCEKADIIASYEVRPFYTKTIYDNVKYFLNSCQVKVSKDKKSSFFAKIS